MRRHHPRNRGIYEILLNDRSTTMSAIQLWQEKLDFLQAKEAKAVDPAQQFKLAQDIAEAKARLAELEGDSRGPGSALVPPTSAGVATISAVVKLNPSILVSSLFNGRYL